MSITIHDAIVAINENATAVVEGTNINDCNIIWMNGTTPIAKADIEAKMTELQTAYNNQEYARNRAAAYPSLQEFAEAYCEKEIGDDTTKWDEYVVKYNKVRTDNPK